MNNDGLIDIVVGDRSGKVFFFSRNEDGTLHSEGAFEGVAVNYNSAPTIADWNGDGLLDMLVGSQGIYPSYGVVYYYLNNGTAENPSFSGGGGAILDENNGWIYHFRAQPAIYDLDGDGVQELIVGEADGNFYFHENIGTNEKPVITQGVSLGIQMDADCRLSFTDWNEDGVVDIVAGDYGKNVHVFMGDGGQVSAEKSVVQKSSTAPFSIHSVDKGLVVTLSDSREELQGATLFSMSGKLVSPLEVNENRTILNKGIAKGVYVLKLISNTKVYSRRLSIL